MTKVRIFNEIFELGISIAEFTRRSELSYLTLQRIDQGRNVRPLTLAKAQRTLKQIKAELNGTRRGLKTGPSARNKT